MSSEDRSPAEPSSALPAPLAVEPDEWAGRRRTRLLSFYDRLRGRVEDALSERGRWGPGVAQGLLLVPDVFFLVARLSLDRRVPAEARALLGGALVYFVLPFDLAPEAFLGVGGFLDDLVIASAVLQRALGDDLEELADEYWSGSVGVRRVLSQVADNVDLLLSGRGLDRVKAYLRERGLA